MGDGAGSSRPGICKWHPRQQGDGVCAICLRISLEKLAAYQREHQEPPDSYTGGFSSTSVAEFSRERDNSGQSFQPSYPSVSYRTRSRKESKPKGAFSSQDGSTSDSRKQKDGSAAKSRLSWGVAVHRIASIRSAFTSLWKSDRQPEDKRKQTTVGKDKHHGRAQGQNTTTTTTHEVERKEKFDNGQHSRQSGKLTPLAASSVNGEPKRNSSSSPWTGSSSFISKLTHRSSNAEESRTRWRRSKSSREGKRDAETPAAPEDGPRTPDGNQGYDAPSPLQQVPHPSSKTSPWMFFSRSGSRRSPFKLETPKGTPRRSVASEMGSRAQPVLDVRRYPLSRGPSPKPDAVLPMSKSALSSPSLMAIQDPHSQTSLGSKSSSLSRTLSSSSSKPSPLYLPPRTMEIHGYSPSRGSTDVPQEFHEQRKAVTEA